MLKRPQRPHQKAHEKNQVIKKANWCGAGPETKAVSCGFRLQNVLQNESEAHSVPLVLL